MVTVFAIDQLFTINIYADPKKKTAKGLVQIIVRPLKYSQKNKINTVTVSSTKGEYFIDQALSIYLTLKYSIQSVKGLKNPDGSNYQLEFETDGEDQILTDSCVEALINCELGYVLNFYAKDAINGTPHRILNPATFRPVDGVELKPFKETTKKK